MNTSNQTRKSPSIHTIICVALSLLSAIGGLAILITVSGFKIIPVVVVVFGVAYIVSGIDFHTK